MSTINTSLLARQRISTTDLKSLHDASPLAKLVRHAQSYRLRRRQAVPASSPDSVFFIRAGVVAAESSAVPTSRSIVELLYPGDMIAGALTPQTPGVNYITMSATELWRIPANTLKSEMAADPAIADAIFLRLNQQRARMQLHITMLAGLPSDQRVAALLLQAAYRLGTNIGGAYAFDMPLSRNEVAEYLALNADTLSRIMSRLVREGVLAKSSRAQITVRNMDALKANCPLAELIASLHADT
jgi:CRP/FNR family transcriptional regulator, anaerobic regulatory protein